MILLCYIVAVLFFPAAIQSTSGIIQDVQADLYSVAILYQDTDDLYKGKVLHWGRLPNGSFIGLDPDNQMGANTPTYAFGSDSSICSFAYTTWENVLMEASTFCFLVTTFPSVYPDVRCFGANRGGVNGWGNTTSVLDFPGDSTPITPMPSGEFSVSCLNYFF